MKKILTLFTLFAFTLAITAPAIYAQVPEKITVNTTDLTPDQLAKIQAEKEVAELQKKLETYGNWVGIGGEIGKAIKEGLTAIVDVADKFGSTNVGRFTMVLIAWKIVGVDVARILLGLLFIFITTWFIWFSFRRTCLERRVIVEDPGFMKYPKKYEVIEPKFSDGNGLGAIRLLHILAFFITIWITYSIMF